jgi:hypothetical protein
MIAAIVIEKWKLSIFDTHLTTAGFAYTNAGDMPFECFVLHISFEFHQIDTLRDIVERAYTEAALLTIPQGPIWIH